MAGTSGRGGVEVPALRVAEVLAPLSLVMDLGMGLPDEHAMRSCLLATGLARRMGLPESEVSDVYYATLLKHLGCTATAEEEAARLGGDELATRPVISRMDEGRPSSMLASLLEINAGRGLAARARGVLGGVTGVRWGPRVQTAICEVAAMMAARLGMTPAVQRAVSQAYERWDGKGVPHRLAGADIEPAARIATLAECADTYCGLGGPDAAIEAVRKSAGGWFDPEVADAFTDHGRQLLEEVAAGDVMAATLAAEPQPRRSVRTPALGEVATAFADMTDLKSTYTLGHSTGVARLVETAAAAAGIDGDEAEELRLAALLHDLGRVGVPAGVWAKRSRLSAGDWERVRLHPYYSERILVRAPALRAAASIAGMHHERLDGSGYYRGARAREVPMAARLLAAADTYQAKTEPRPHRAPLSPEEAAAALTEEASAGRLDAEAVACVVEAAGQRRPHIPREVPAGLTDRELEVLRLVAQGCSNQDIADRLVISRRTAEHHVQHIYDKIGASTRAAASMFAMQHDLLAPPPDQT